MYALERLPLVTPGVLVEFSLIYRAGTDAHSYMKYINFRIYESEFEISRGGTVFDSSVGSDCFSEPGWLVNIHGYRETECDVFEIEYDIVNYLNLGAEISVFDDSQIDYEYSDEE